MNSRILAVLALVAAWHLPAIADAGERKAARVECTPVDQQPLVYDCMFVLKGRKSNAPIAGAEFTVGADMPSMPGAHTIPPVTAGPQGKPGMYRARITLDMTGEWALKLDFTKPDRDRLVEKLHFGGAKKGGGHKH